MLVVLLEAHPDLATQVVEELLVPHGIYVHGDYCIEEPLRGIRDPRAETH